jgi:hypothetical protein
MKELFLVCGDYLKGKEIYPPIRRAITLLVNISVASFIFEKCYGKYTFLDIQDYKGIVAFFIKGNFFIPFALFIIVCGITYLFSTFIFIAITHFRSTYLIRKIVSYEVKKDEIKDLITSTTKIPKYASPIDLTEDILVNLYAQFRTELKPEVIDSIAQQLELPKKNIESNFHLGFRLLIVITIYFSSIPQFGWVLYVISILTIIIAIYLQMISYQFLAILPTLIRKFHAVAENYFLTLNKKEAK